MNAVTTAIAPYQTKLMDPASFDQMQRVGKMLALSPLFPQHLRPNMDTGIANGVLVLNMAMRLNEDVLTVAQNIYFVGGRPGWAATYMIAKANQSGVFKNPIDWSISGAKDTLAVTANAELAATGKPVSVTVDMAMARAEGWTKNAKYQSMPEQMLRYRSATFLIRLYCPEVMVGVPSVAELEDDAMKDVTPAGVFDQVEARSSRATSARSKPAAVVQAEPIVEAAVVEVVRYAKPAEEPKVAVPEPKPEPKAEVKAEAELPSATAAVVDDPDEPLKGTPAEVASKLIKLFGAADSIEELNTIWNKNGAMIHDEMEKNLPDLFASVADKYDARCIVLAKG